MPIPWSRQGDSVPLVTMPSPLSVCTGLPWRGMPGPVKANGTSFWAVVPGSGSLSAPMKSGLALAAPAEAGLDRVVVLVEVVAVEVEADLEAERVSGAEAGWSRAVLRERVPDLRGSIRRDQQLDAVLACVAGAGHEAADAGDLGGGGPETLRGIALEMAFEDVACVRALEGEHRVVGGGVRDGDVEGRCLLLEPREVLLVVGGVRDGEELAVALEAVGEEVVEDAAVGLAEDAVLGAFVGDLAYVVGEDPLEELLRLRPGRLDLAHVRDVEQAGARADVHVLLADALVLDRHLPAGERNEPCVGGLMTLVERRASEGLGGRAQEGCEATG